MSLSNLIYLERIAKAGMWLCLAYLLVSLADVGDGEKSLDRIAVERCIEVGGVPLMQPIWTTTMGDCKVIAESKTESE